MFENLPREICVVKQCDFIFTSVASSAKLKMGRGGKLNRGERREERGEELEENRYMEVSTQGNFRA